MPHYYTIVGYLKGHPMLGLFLTFVIAAAECIPFIGTIIPGSVTMTAVGILVGSGIMSPWLALIAAIAGAVAGDSLGLAIGYYYQERLETLWPFRKYPHWLDRGRAFVASHGGKSVFIGRFASPIRAMVPLVAGMLRISLVRFYIADGLSAIGWALLYMSPGFLLGKASLNIPPELATKVIILALLMLIIIWLVTWGMYLLSRWFYHRANIIATRLWQRMQSHRATHPLCWLLRNGEHNEGQFGCALFFIIVCLLFVIMVIHLALSGELTYWNEAVYHLFRGLSEVILRKIFIVLSMLGQDDVILASALPLFIWFGWRKQWRIAWHLLALVMITVGAVGLTKVFIHAPRPPGIQDISLLSASFPSGHTAFAVTMYGFIGYLLTTVWPQRRKLIYWCVAAICGVVIVSRLYLSLHWFSDIIGSLLIGLSCLLPVIISYRRYPRTPFSAPALVGIIIVAVLIAGWGHLARHYKDMVYAYRPVWPSYPLQQDKWWRNRGVDTVPLYRTTRLGRPAQILNVQWAGELAPIRATLTAAQWQLIPVHRLVTLFSMTTETGQSDKSIAIAEKLERDHLPVIIAIKPLSNNRQILLFLWPANVRLLPDNLPLWVGTLYYKKGGRHHFFHEHVSADMAAEAIQRIVPALNAYHYRRVTIDNEKLPARLTNGAKHSYQLLIIKPATNTLTDE